MRKLDILQLELEKESEVALLNGLPYIHTMRAFSKVVQGCFGMDLVDSFGEDIREFRRLYLSLGVTVTPKVFQFSMHIKIYQIISGTHSFPACW